MNKRFLTLIIALVLMLEPLGALAQSSDEEDRCAYGPRDVNDRFLLEQREFEPTIDILTRKPTVPTEILVETGVRNLRQYRSRLQKICSDAAAYNRENPDNECVKKTRGEFTDQQLHCERSVEVELQYQQAVFEQLMLYDVTKKKVKYLTDKYKELNKKFASLLDLVIGVHNGLHTLNSKVKYVAEQCQE